MVGEHAGDQVTGNEGGADPPFSADHRGLLQEAARLNLLNGASWDEALSLLVNYRADLMELARYYLVDRGHWRRRAEEAEEDADRLAHALRVVLNGPTCSALRLHDEAVNARG